MTRNQRALVEKTLCFAGISSIVGIFALMLYGSWLTISRDKPASWFLKGLFDVDGGGSLLYPLSVIAAISLWLRSFLRAGAVKDRAE